MVIDVNEMEFKFCHLLDTLESGMRTKDILAAKLNISEKTMLRTISKLKSLNIIKEAVGKDSRKRFFLINELRHIELKEKKMVLCDVLKIKN